MASSKGQGLLIAVIAFAALSGLLAIISFAFYQRSMDLRTRFDLAQQARKDADKKARDYLDQITKLKELIGYPQYELNQLGSPDDLPEEQAKTLMGRIRFDLQKYADSANPNYSSAVHRLAHEVGELQEQFQTVSAIYAELEAESKLKRHLEAQKIAVVETAYKEADADREKVQQAADQKQQQQLKAYQQLEQVARKARDRETQIEQDLESHTTKTNRQLNTLTLAIRERKEKLQRLRSVGQPVGVVLSVEYPPGYSRSTTKKGKGPRGFVYLNLGQADGLTLRTTFSVWDVEQIATAFWQDKNRNIEKQAEEEFQEQRASVTAHKQSGPKGAVEVVAILGPHQSRARITDSSLANPIASGDKLYSPIFSPGRSVQVALAGFIDLDGEGGDDRDQLINIIKRQGGSIEAWTDDEGRIQSVSPDPDHPIRPGTDWLVRGDRPEAIDTSTGQQSEHSRRLNTSFDELQKVAKRLGVKIIDQHQFYKFMGLGSLDYTYELGTYAGGPTPRKRFENPNQTTRPPTLGQRRFRNRPGNAVFMRSKRQAN